MIYWECVRNGIKIARMEHDGVIVEPTREEIGDTVISIIKTMSNLAVEIQFEDLMRRHHLPYC